MQRSAVLSDCKTYRYALTREWDTGLRALWIMLNPSTADALVDDPTIRRCISFSRSLGMGSLEVVNLFAFRATDPNDMATAQTNGIDVVGPENDATITAAALRADTIVAAWGADKLAPLRSVSMRRLVAPRVLFALGKTKSGAPKHPLYLPSNSVLVPL